MTDKISGGKAVYEVLKSAGIDTVFGLLGGSMLELYDAIYTNDGIRYVGARDERAAGHMADAWARMTGKTGVVLGAQAGPGVVNLVTAVAEAHLAYSPLLVIAGAISRSDLGKDTFQEVDQVALFAPICKKSILVTDPERLPEMVVDAIRLANSGRRGPVVLHVPRDLMAAQISQQQSGPVTIARAGPPRQSDVAEMVSLLQKSQKPVIFAGAGLKWGRGTDSLRLLAESIEIPVVSSTGHADLMPHDHPWFAGQGGPRGNHVASELTRDADLIVALGARFGFNSTFHSHDYVSSTANIVQVDIEGSAVGRYFPVSLACQADAAATVKSLISACAVIDFSSWQPWRDQFVIRRKALLAERENEACDPSVPMHPRRALAEIRKVLPKNAVVTLDTGNACLQAADRLAHWQCPGLITPLDFGLVGFAYAAALGAKAACPDRPVISVMGDGGFGYTMAELSSAVDNSLPVVAVILDNGAWGAEKAYQQEFFGGRLLGASITSPPYDKVAELCGGRGWQADTPEVLACALTEALACEEPAVVHVKIDPNALNTLRKDLFNSKY